MMKPQHNNSYASNFVYDYTNDILTAKLVGTSTTTLQVATLEATPTTIFMAIPQGNICNFMTACTCQKVSQGLGGL